MFAILSQAKMNQDEDLPVLIRQNAWIFTPEMPESHWEPRVHLLLIPSPVEIEVVQSIEVEVLQLKDEPPAAAT